MCQSRGQYLTQHRQIAAAPRTSASTHRVVWLPARRTVHRHRLILEVEDQIRQCVVLLRQYGPVTGLNRFGALMDEVSNFISIARVDIFGEEGLATFAEVFGGREQAVGRG